MSRWSFAAQAQRRIQRSILVRSITIELLQRFHAGVAVTSVDVAVHDDGLEGCWTRLFIPTGVESDVTGTLSWIMELAMWLMAAAFPIIGHFLYDTHLEMDWMGLGISLNIVGIYTWMDECKVREKERKKEEAQGERVGLLTVSFLEILQSLQQQRLMIRARFFSNSSR